MLISERSRLPALRKFLLLGICFCISFSAKAQLSSTDSAFFNSIFTDNVYVNQNIWPGKWFVDDSVNSITEFNSAIDSNFKFKYRDFDSISSMQVANFLEYDSVRNSLFNLYSFVLQQPDPIIKLPFILNGKSSCAYSILNTSNFGSSVKKNAFIIMQGTGTNGTIDVVTGNGYHNLNCYEMDHLRQKGDVFTLIKPNEDIRAIRWNNKKLGSYIFPYLEAYKRHYGLTYLAELIALTKYLKQHYLNVVVCGLSEGGYAALLASLYEEPDGVVVSGGYSIDFDTYAWSNTVLRTRFDSLLDQYTRVPLKNRLMNSQSNYLFTWGDLETVPLMQEEHDSLFTQNYFNGAPKNTYYYNFNYHSFPPCEVIDSFLVLVDQIPKCSFEIVDSSKLDTILCRIAFIGKGAPFSFDMYRDSSLFASYQNCNDSLFVNLNFSGNYTIRNIRSAYDSLIQCNDTVAINFPTPLFISGTNSNEYLRMNNPFTNNLNIDFLTENHEENGVEIFDLNGVLLYASSLEIGIKRICIPTSNWRVGIYLLKITNSNRSVFYKLLKQS